MNTKNKGRICASPDCDKPAEIRGYCENHYRKFRRAGLIPQYKEEDLDHVANAIVAYLPRPEFNILVAAAEKKDQPVELYVGTLLATYARAMRKKKEEADLARTGTGR